MIYELRTYTLKQGAVPDVAKAAGTVGRDIRKDDYGKLEGYWQTEIGPLNQVLPPVELSGFEPPHPAARRARQEPALGRRVCPADPAKSSSPGDPPAQRGEGAGGSGADAECL